MQAAVVIEPDRAFAFDGDRRSPHERIIAPTVTHWSRILYVDLFEGTDETAEAHATGAGAVTSGANSATAQTPATQPRRDSEWMTLSAADGYPITAIRYPSRAPVRAHVVIAGAVGIPQRFYRRFAEYAASIGCATMTFDYRGVGLSAPTTLEGFEMDYFDWGRFDLAAAVDAMSNSQLPLYVIGHSFGGHGFGLLPNHERVSAFYTFGTGAGWHGWMPPLERAKVLAISEIVGPALTRWKGYLPLNVLGLGEDLPLAFYDRWKHWCHSPNYFFGDRAVRHVTQGFDRIRAPLMAVNATDDHWAPPRSRDAFIAGYRNAARHTLDLDPMAVGLRSIGHMGYFKPAAQPLWESALDWLVSRRKFARADASIDSDSAKLSVAAR
jgi:predicted alpha/beta hydrolase